MHVDPVPIRVQIAEYIESLPEEKGGPKPHQRAQPINTVLDAGIFEAAQRAFADGDLVAVDRLLQQAHHEWAVQQAARLRPAQEVDDQDDQQDDDKGSDSDVHAH